jgi:tRNA uridine 5-carboxymethylaminomethyl modification enzyme
MFTSRAEYRLMLREDNADLRLTESGRKLGLVDDARWDAFSRKRDAIARETERLKSTWVNPRNLPAETAIRVLGHPIEREYTLYDLLRRPNVSYRSLSLISSTVKDLEGSSVEEQVEIQAKYQGYIARQLDEVERHSGQASVALPADLDYAEVGGLSIEARQTLTRQRPETIGQAARISGITPAAISLLLVHLRRLRKQAPLQQKRA